MDTKLFEIRDSCTMISAIGIDLHRWGGGNGREDKLIRHAGYGDRCILLGKLRGGHFSYDPYDQGDCRTMRTAHHYIRENWDTLKSGDIIDVEFILGETTEKCETDLGGY